MPLTTSSLRGGRENPGALQPPTPDEAREDLEKQRAEIEKRIAADDQRIALARRGPLVEELKTLFLPDEPRLRDLETQIKNEKFDAEERQMLRIQYAKIDAERLAAASKISRRREEVRRELLSTASPLITAEIERLGNERQKAIAAGKYRTAGDQTFSNGAAVNAFVAAVDVARGALAELLLLAIDDAELQKRIRAILKSIPNLDLNLKELVSK